MKKCIFCDQQAYHQEIVSLMEFTLNELEDTPNNNQVFNDLEEAFKLGKQEVYSQIYVKLREIYNEFEIDIN